LTLFAPVCHSHPLTTGEFTGGFRHLLVVRRVRRAKKGYEVQFTEDLVALIAREGFDDLFGARPIRLYIQDHVEDVLATAQLEGRLKPREPFVVDAKMIQ